MVRLEFSKNARDISTLPWTASKTPLPVSHFPDWDTVRHLTLVSQDTPSFPTLQHFFDKWTDGFLPEHLMDLRRRKSGFPDRSLPRAAGFDGWHSWNQKPRFSPKPDLRLLGHLVSGFHMIHPKYALVSQQNHCWCNFHMDCRNNKILCSFNECDGFNRWQPISNNDYPILWWIRAGQLRVEKLAQFSAVFSICRPNLVGWVGGRSLISSHD